jgi:hypothetical protein
MNFPKLMGGLIGLEKGEERRSGSQGQGPMTNQQHQVSEG